MPIDRRGFLGALALAPAAVAACATGGAAATAERPPARSGPSAAAAAPEAPAPAGGLEAVRDLPLPRSAEPSFTFRAAVFRAGEP
jgi:hypothetical protein